MHIFWNKNIKLPTPESPLASGSWGLCPQTPTLLLLLTIVNLSSTFLALNAFYYPQKNNNIITVNVLLLLLPQLLHLFFISNSIVFVDGRRKNIFCPRAQYTLATPLLKQSWKIT